MEVEEQPILDAQAALAESGMAEESMPIEGAHVDTGNLAVFSYELPDGESHMETATRLAQELIAKIFVLPVERSEVGPLAVLPYPKTPIPREKSVPTPKAETKWEKFAKEKGIRNKKKDRKIWDEKTQSWKYSWGRDGINKDDDWVVEHKEGALGDFEDPFIQRKTLKKQRIEANEKKRQVNKRNAAISASKDVVGSRNTASLVVGTNAPLSGPVSEERIKRAIQLAQKSTRSMGAYDTKRSDEPRIKPTKMHLPQDSAAEKAQTTKILKKVVRQAETTEYDREKMANQQIQSEKNTAKKKRAAKEEAREEEKRKRKMK